MRSLLNRRDNHRSASQDSRRHESGEIETAAIESCHAGSVEVAVFARSWLPAGGVLWVILFTAWSSPGASG
jgi:hypothetical protein